MSADVAKEEIALVVVNRRVVAGKRGQQNILQATAIEVANVDTHSRLGLSRRVESGATPGPDFGELAVPVVAVEEVRVRVVRNKDMDPAIIIEVGSDNSQSIRFSFIRHADLVGCVNEGPVPSIVKKVVSPSPQPERSHHDLDRVSPDVGPFALEHVVEGAIDVTGYVEIQVAVTVGIKECRAVLQPLRATPAFSAISSNVPSPRFR